MTVGFHQLAQWGVSLDLELDRITILPGHFHANVVILCLPSLLGLFLGPGGRVGAMVGN